MKNFPSIGFKFEAGRGEIFPTQTEGISYMKKSESIGFPVLIITMIVLLACVAAGGFLGMLAAMGAWISVTCIGLMIGVMYPKNFKVRWELIFTYGSILCGCSAALWIRLQPDTTVFDSFTSAFIVMCFFHGLAGYFQACRDLPSQQLVIADN